MGYDILQTTAAGMKYAQAKEKLQQGGVHCLGGGRQPCEKGNSIPIPIQPPGINTDLYVETYTYFIE